MAYNKKDEFSKEDQNLAIIGKAMSHPARLAILRKLAKSDSCMCGEIVEDLPLAQSTVSQHLKELKDAGLVKGTIDGPRSCYCIDHEKWEELETSLDAFLFEMKALKIDKNCC